MMGAAVLIFIFILQGFGSVFAVSQEAHSGKRSGGVVVRCHLRS
jgi:hypothetical protein